ncbi:MAG: FAD-binding protein [Halovenus sp.]
MVRAEPEHWDRATDVVVIGSGTGLAAALAAVGGGADVLVLEKSPYIGGTTAVSGGGSWVPNSRPVLESVGETPREELLTYLRKVTGGRTPEEKLERYVDDAPVVYEYIEEETPVEFTHARGLSDYHAEFEGGDPDGRMIVPEFYDGDRLGDKLAHVRESPHFPLPVTYEEIKEGAGSATVFPLTADYDTLHRRKENNVLGTGRALIGGLYEALLNRDVEFEREVPATELIMDGDAVVGVVAEVDGTETKIGAGAVIIAAGGLEWDDEMREQFLRGPLTGPASPPYNEGDGIVLGTEAGAKLGNTDEAFWFPTVDVPGETWEDGSSLYRLETTRHLPGAIIVNEAGERFTDETMNYNDISKSFHEFDPHEYEYRNLPAYQIMDHRFRESYPLVSGVLPDDDLPEWITTGETLADLAGKLGVNADGLRTTVRQFNEHARDGEDPEFHAGSTAFGQKRGDPEAAHPNLAPLEEPPYYAFELQPGAIGTKGGLVTSIDAEVLDTEDTPIPGLYASSNSAAHIMGLGYAGGGATIGPNIVYGFIAGENAAGFATQ